jgi:rhodanese-related sulfurtransferase
MNKNTKALLLLGGIFLLFVGLFMTWSKQSPVEQTIVPTISKLSGVDFQRTFKETSGAVLIDVRTPAEFAAGHISGAINIDFEDVSFPTEVSKLDPNTPYFIYCRSGRRSGLSAEIMKKAGILNITDLQGGIVANPDILSADFSITPSVSIDIGTDAPLVVSLSKGTSSISDEERKGLLQMREEEKLAHDVYVKLGAEWNIPVFTNIARSESTHTTAVLGLLNTYQIADPVGSTPVEGVFTDPKIQDLYNTLTTRGALSLNDALAVGALIEDLDIVDLETLLGQTTRDDMTQVYSNLQRGSRNHLRSFVSQLESRGGTYTPSYLSKETFEQIMTSPRETGAGGGRGGR